MDTARRRVARRETGPAIRDLTLAEVQAYDVGRLAPGSAYHAKYPEYEPIDGARIPTLQQVLELVVERAPADFQLWLELKLAPPAMEQTTDAVDLAEAALALIAGAGLTAHTTVISFYWPALYYVQRVLPGIETCFLSIQQPREDNIAAGKAGVPPWTAPLDARAFDGSVPAIIKAAGGSAWSVYWQDLTSALVTEARALGLSVGV